MSLFEALAVVSTQNMKNDGGAWPSPVVGKVDKWIVHGQQSRMEVRFKVWLHCVGGPGDLEKGFFLQCASTCCL